MEKINGTDCLVYRKHPGEIDLLDLLSQLGLSPTLISMYKALSTRLQVISLY